MVISALDKDTVKFIATTQVITSVSSAAKELIENSLDADSKNIEINLTDNGCTLIEVKDDGCGISKADAPHMALSSYTSKIFSFSDLDSLKTYGFRGEALYALSSVSDLTIISKTKQDDAAISYNIDHYGHIVKTESCHRPTGTTVQVRQLFKRMPVRRQIITNIKLARQDIKTLESLIKSYGMCKFDVRICYRVDKTIVFAKPSVATFEEAVTYILGRSVISNMDWIDITDTDIKIKIMVPSKKTQIVPEIIQGGAQYIFVNNRPVKYKELEKVATKTILEALGQESSSRKKPTFILHILVDAASIDVNLEPNKTCILFKKQNMIINIIEKYLESFYEIRKEMQEKDNCDGSPTDCQDNTQKTDINNTETEGSVCKKRKLETEESIDEPFKKVISDNEDVVKNLNSVKTNISEHKGQTQISAIEQNYQTESIEKSNKIANNFDVQLPVLALSDTDSNDSQNFTLLYCDNKVSYNTAEDTPPFELTPQSETLSQLPVVDLGENFEWNDCSYTHINEKQNEVQNANTEIPAEENKLNTKKRISLEEWSKGHVSGLRGGTNVESYKYAESDEPTNNDGHKNVCDGFRKFSRHIRLEVMERNPAMTAPQIAYVITNLWKKLSPEERGYYRNLAREEKSERELRKRETVKKQTIDTNKNKNRLLKALEKMKMTNSEEKKDLVMRTLVPWNIDLKKITEGNQNNSSFKSTNFVVGLLHSDLWVIYKSAHIWILDTRKLKEELHVGDTNTNKDDAKNIEQLLEQWFSIKDDMSLLHPIHSLT